MVPDRKISGAVWWHGRQSPGWGQEIWILAQILGLDVLWRAVKMGKMQYQRIIRKILKKIYHYIILRGSQNKVSQQYIAEWKFY